MSAGNVIRFKFSTEEEDPTEVLRFMLSHGWTLDIENRVNYIAPATIHSDNCKWNFDPIECFDCESYLRESREQKCLVIQLLVAAEQYGADLRLTDAEGSLNIWDTSHPLMNDSRIADFSWYLRKLHDVFNTFGVHELECRYYD